jgi:hypothetical protein
MRQARTMRRFRPGPQRVLDRRKKITAPIGGKRRGVERAIDMRWSGKPWDSIVSELGHPTISIQARIWKHLYLIGMLDRQTVESIASLSAT